MNTERLNDLANIIERHEITELDFSMADWCRKHTAPNSCGTVACIAGTAYYAAYGPKVAHWCFSDIKEKAEEILGLSSSQAGALFTPTEYLHNITPAQAAQALRLIAGGTSIIEAWRKVGVPV